ncbi:hypothetical protein GCM10017673_10650 [Streptosporangium violaceochromogenes]|nr:hypothetical protein GCM10017673_10650 [Streptosporangium violaceochromogenes]
MARSRVTSPGDPGAVTFRYVRHACAARAAFAMGEPPRKHVRLAAFYPAASRYNAYPPLRVPFLPSGFRSAAASGPPPPGPAPAAHTAGGARGDP